MGAWDVKHGGCTGFKFLGKNPQEKNKENEVILLQVIKPKNRGTFKIWTQNHGDYRSVPKKTPKTLLFMVFSYPKKHILSSVVFTSQLGNKPVSSVFLQPSGPFPWLAPSSPPLWDLPGSRAKGKKKEQGRKRWSRNSSEIKDHESEEERLVPPRIFEKGTGVDGRWKKISESQGES